jgi:hypothetical protein
MSSDTYHAKDDFMSFQQFHWFTGVIEDVDDPEQRGRYRVRCFGYHTEKRDYIPTTTLPWAHVMMPVTGASQCGVGESATGLLRGTWVVGFFRDGATAQDPLIMGSIPATTPKVDYDFGFCDPAQIYPYKDKIGDQDIPEEAISKDDVYKDSFSYKKKEEHRDLTPVQIALNGTWDLPPVDEINKLEYPKNHVKAWERTVPKADIIADESDVTGILDKDIEKVVFFDKKEGEEPDKEMHVQEFDVTPDWERVSTMHKSGTYHEWTPKGDETVVIVGDEYRIIINNQHINIKGDYTLTVEGNYHRKVLGNEFHEVLGNRVEMIYGNVVKTVGMNQIYNTSLNTLSTNGMNIMQTTGMNKVENTTMFHGEFNGLGKHVTNKGPYNEMNIATRAQTTIGLSSIGNVAGENKVTIGKLYEENLTVKESITLLDRSDNVWGNHKLHAGIGMNIGGTTLNLGSVGPTHIECVGLTINTGAPVVIPL